MIHQSSHFFHFKDDTFIKRCTTLEEVQKKMKLHMIYYDYHRCQRDRKNCPLYTLKKSLKGADSFTL